MTKDIVWKQIGAALLCLLAIAYGSPTGATNGFVTVDDLKADLQSRNIDRILRSLNVVKQMKYQGEVLPFLLDLWSNQRKKHPRLPWDTINLDIVKLDIGNVLLQAERNGRIQMDKYEVFDFASRLIDSSDVQVAQNAIITLSLIDEPRAVERILSAAKQDHKLIFRASVLALNSMCDPSAQKALDQLEMLAKDAEEKAEIQEDRRNMMEYKARTGMCKKGR